MKRLILLPLIAWLLCAETVESGYAAEKATLDVLNMQQIPPGDYEVKLQFEGKEETVRIAIKGNRATFVKASSGKHEGLAGEFELIGNGVYLARLACKGGSVSQWWLFKPDGSAVVKEIPDRGEKQVAKKARDQ